MRKKLLCTFLISVISGCYDGSKDEEDTKKDTFYESNESIGVESYVAFGSNLYYSYPGERFTFELFTTDENHRTHVYDKTNISKVRIGDNEYNDLSDIRSPSYLGKFPIVVYDLQGQQVAYSEIMTDKALKSVELVTIDGSSDTYMNRIKEFRAMGVFSDNVKQDITNSVDWKISGDAISKIKEQPNKAYTASTGNIDVTISYGGMTDSFSSVVKDSPETWTSEVLVGKYLAKNGIINIPGKGNLKLNLTNYFVDNEHERLVSFPERVFWKVVPKNLTINNENSLSKEMVEGVTIDEDMLYIERDNVEFILEAYLPNISFDGGLGLTNSPISSTLIKVKDYNTEIIGLELLLKKNHYTVGDIVEYQINELYEGFKQSIQDLKSINWKGDMLIADSQGQVVVAKPSSGDIYVELKNNEQITSNKIKIDIVDTSFEKLSIQASDANSKEYKLNIAYSFELFKHSKNEPSRLCSNCSFVLKDEDGNAIPNEKFTINSSGEIIFHEVGKYFLYGKFGDKYSDYFNIEVKDYAIESISIKNVSPIIKSFLGDYFKPLVLANFKDSGVKIVPAEITVKDEYSDYVNIIGGNVYPLQNGEFELTANYSGLTVTIPINLEIIPVVVKDVIIDPLININKNIFYSPKLNLVLDDGIINKFEFNEVKWDVPNGVDLSLNGFLVTDEYYGQELEITGSVMFNNMLYKASLRNIQVKDDIINDIKVFSYENVEFSDEIKTGDFSPISVRYEMETKEGERYNLWIKTTTVLNSNNNARIVEMNSNADGFVGVKPGEVTLYFYREDGEFLLEKNVVIIDDIPSSLTAYCQRDTLYYSATFSLNKNLNICMLLSENSERVMFDDANFGSEVSLEYYSNIQTYPRIWSKPTSSYFEPIFYFNGTEYRGSSIDITESLDTEIEIDSLLQSEDGTIYFDAVENLHSVSATEVDNLNDVRYYANGTFNVPSNNGILKQIDTSKFEIISEGETLIDFIGWDSNGGLLNKHQESRKVIVSPIVTRLENDNDNILTIGGVDGKVIEGNIFTAKSVATYDMHEFNVHVFNLNNRPGSTVAVKDVSDGVYYDPKTWTYSFDPGVKSGKATYTYKDEADVEMHLNVLFAERATFVNDNDGVIVVNSNGKIQSGYGLTYREFDSTKEIYSRIMGSIHNHPSGVSFVSGTNGITYDRSQSKFIFPVGIDSGIVSFSIQGKYFDGETIADFNIRNY